MRHWTEKTDREAQTFFATLSEREIRERQAICNEQIGMAYRERMEDALEDLQAMSEALARSMMERLSR